MASKQPIIGVLALQGDFSEHLAVIRRLGYLATAVRTKRDCAATDGLIIPGGESTTIGRQLRATATSLGEFIKQRAQRGYPLFGTCAGCILLAKRVDSPFSLRLIDIEVKRNAYGRQLDSFNTPLRSKIFPKLDGVFIRAPIIQQVGSTVTTLAWNGKQPVLVQQNQILAATFHPELTGDTAVHKYFINLVRHQR